MAGPTTACWILLAALVALAWRDGAAEPPQTATLCVVHRQPTRGLEPATLDDALRLELRKAALDVGVTQVERPRDCPAPGKHTRAALLRIEGPARVTFVDVSHHARVLDVSAVDPIDRGQAVARAVVSGFERDAARAAPGVTRRPAAVHVGR